AASLDKGGQPNVDYSYKAHSTARRVFSFFNALGTISFAYAGHNIVLEIQATIPSTPKKPCKDPIWKGVMVAYIVIAICYFPVAIIGSDKNSVSICFPMGITSLRFAPQLHESAGGLPKTKLVSHSCSLAGSTSAMKVSIPIAFVLPGREHECNESFKLGRSPALS
ncbi:lysine histidine transporter 1-like protein, partial [Tanacetum coccineum]